MPCFKTVKSVFWYPVRLNVDPRLSKLDYFMSYKSRRDSSVNRKDRDWEDILKDGQYFEWNGQIKCFLISLGRISKSTFWKLFPKNADGHVTTLNLYLRSMVVKFSWSLNSTLPIKNQHSLMVICFYDHSYGDSYVCYASLVWC